MGLFDKVLGNASEANPEQIQKKFADIFIPEEKVQSAFVLVRDTFIFTNKRVSSQNFGET